MDVRLPDHALPVLGRIAGFDWATALWMPLSLAGLAYGGVAVFAAGAIILTTDLDNDIDGPGGDNHTDRYWQPETSLKTAAGKSCDSREFPGYVMTPALRQYGVRMGDFGLAVWNGSVVAFQVYDSGPTNKAGEASIRLARELGTVRPQQSDHFAANNGHTEQDVSAVIFPNSAPGTGESVPNHAISPEVITQAAFGLLHKLTGTDAPSLT